MALALLFRKRVTRLHVVLMLFLAALPDVVAAQTASDRRPAPDDGFTLTAGGGTLRLRIGGYAHLDGRFDLGEESAASDTFLVRRLRPQLQGSLGERFAFVFMPDFGGGQATLQDGWLDGRFHDRLHVRVGKLKSPVGLERLQSSTSLLFVERGLPSGVAPNRDVGLLLLGDVATGRLAWAAGVLDGAPDGGSVDTDDGDAKDLVARLAVQPWRNTAGSPWRGLRAAMAASTGRTSGRLASYRTAGQQAFFSWSNGTVADGQRWRLAPQASWTGGPVRAFAEWTATRHAVTGAGTSADVDVRAWQVAAAVMLTGEAASWEPVDPRRPFDAKSAGRGGWEATARFGELVVGADAFRVGFADADVSARRARELAVGINWSPIRNVKYVVNLARTTFTGGARAGDRPTETILLLRAQVAF